MIKKYGSNKQLGGVVAATGELGGVIAVQRGVDLEGP